MHHIQNAVACAGLHAVHIGEAFRVIILDHIDDSRVDVLSSDVSMQRGPIVSIVVKYAMLSLMVQSPRVREHAALPVVRERRAVGGRCSECDSVQRVNHVKHLVSIGDLYSLPFYVFLFLFYYYFLLFFLAF